MALILASNSPRRRELLALVTPAFTVRPSSVDESRITAPTPALLARELAAAKARDVAAACPGDIVLGSDTVVDCGGQVFGKPRNREDVLRMLRALSGRAHKVHTGLSVCAGRPHGRHGGDHHGAFCPPSQRPSCRPTPIPPSPTTRRAPMPSRAGRRCGAAASRDATTTSWGLPVHRTAQLLAAFGLTAVTDAPCAGPARHRGNAVWALFHAS